MTSNVTYDNWTVTWPSVVYKYQVRCPKCKSFNWLELEKVTPCHKCSSKLKASMETPDYTIPIKV